MKTQLSAALVLMPTDSLFAQYPDVRDKDQFYTSGCGRDIRVSILSSEGTLLSTLTIPGDVELAIFSDSSARYYSGHEFLGNISIRTVACKDVPVNAKLDEVSASAPFHVEPHDVVVRVNDAETFK